MNSVKILLRPKIGRFCLNLAILGHIWPISEIYILLGLFLKTEKNFKQYFYHGHAENVIFYILNKFQEVTGSFRGDIKV